MKFVNYKNGKNALLKDKQIKKRAAEIEGRRSNNNVPQINHSWYRLVPVLVPLC